MTTDVTIVTTEAELLAALRRPTVFASPTMPGLPGNLCTVDGCEKRHQARGWCWTHYRRWRSHGDPATVRTLQPCGTKAAYLRHRYHDEPVCDLCAVHTPKKRNLQPHGTTAAHQQHRLRGEPVCDLCRDFNRWRFRTAMRLGLAEIKRRGLTP